MTTFKQFHEAGEPNGLLTSIAQSVRAMSHKDPLLMHIASDPKELEEFLMSAWHVLRAMTPEERNAVPTADGMSTLISRMMQDYQARSPGLNVGQIRQQDDGKGAARKLLQLAAQMAQRIGQPAELYMRLMTDMIKKNPGRVVAWADSIHTPEELLAKFNDWKQRGFFKAVTPEAPATVPNAWTKRA
jgi:hypothetical protein